MSSNGSNLVTVGRVTGVFGVKGWVKVKSFTEPEKKITDYSPWWLKTRYGVKRVEVDEFTFRSQGLIAHIHGYDSRELAATLSRVDIAIEKAQLPALDAGEYYWHQLIGLNVISLFSGKSYVIGEVSHMIETGSNDVVVVKPNAKSMDDRERLVPYVPKEYVLDIDLENNKMIVAWDPEF